MLPYFLRHYTKYAQQVTIFDNRSTDRSVEIVRSFANTAVESFETGEIMDESKLVEIRNTAWKRSRGRADWVIVVDIDEIIYHVDLPGYLASCAAGGITVCWPVGYEMYAREFPATSGQIYEELKFGIPRPKWNDKPVVWNPDAIEEMNLGEGSHTAEPVGRINVDSARRELKLLHYHLLGVDYVLPRYRARRERLTQEMNERKWCFQYHFEADRINKRIGMIESQAWQIVP